MPRYEYKCSDCEKAFEVIHGIDENVDICKFCGGSVRRVFHPVGIHFKGSGFYKTDNKSSSGNSAGATGTRAETQKSDDNGGSSKAGEPKKNDSDSKVSK